jgi:hypothetical protein
MAGKKGQKKRVWSDDEKRSIYAQARLAGVSFVDAADGVPIFRTGDCWEIGCERLIVILFGKIHEKVKPSVYRL